MAQQQRTPISKRLTALRVTEPENGFFSLYMPYDKELLSRIHTVSGSRWDAEDKCWRIFATRESAKAFMDALGEYIPIVPGGILELAGLLPEVSKERRVGFADRRKLYRPIPTNRRIPGLLEGEQEEEGLVRGGAKMTGQGEDPGGGGRGGCLTRHTRARQSPGISILHAITVPQTHDSNTSITDSEVLHTLFPPPKPFSSHTRQLRTPTHSLCAIFGRKRRRRIRARRN